MLMENSSLLLLCNEFDMTDQTLYIFIIINLLRYTFLPGLKTAMALRQPHSLPSGESCLYLLINS